MTSERTRIFPVLLSGGGGSRLWPLSRRRAPKQLLDLVGEGTLLQQTAIRARDPALFEPLTLIAAADHRFTLAEQLRAIGMSGATIVLEPSARNTAAAAATAALVVSRKAPAGLVLLMPADHFISDAEAFRATVAAAAPIARAGAITLFGIRPDSPATGYGYIRTGAPLPGFAAGRAVAAFVEKPDRATAEGYLASGDYLWNSGIFLAPADLLLAELRRFEPGLVEAVTAAVDMAAVDADFLRLDPDSFASAKSISFDYAVMERTDKAAIVPASFAWTDIGAWSALWAIAERDESGNALIGDALAVGTRGSYVRSEGPMVAALGLTDMIVVATDDAVLVAHKDHDQDIRSIVDALARRGGDLT